MFKSGFFSLKTGLFTKSLQLVKRGPKGFGFASLRIAALLVMTIVVYSGIAFSAMTAAAQAETRSLKLYYTHTGERAEIVFKRNGRYDSGGLKKLNRFLRDWRRNEPTKMDPRLFDLIWEVYRQTGSNNYITVVSAYRSPATNEMLRRTRGGQAKKSQHVLGKAMDFYIPGVKLAKLRSIGMKVQGGGVGYYPKSGSPFVHLDVGSVRAWPRMSRSELSQLFPDGKTLHLPPDGKPLPGYQRALAEYKSRGGNIRSSGGSNSSGKKGGGLLAALFGGDEDEGADVAIPSTSPRASGPAIEVAARPVEAAPLVAASANVLPELPVTAPVPISRPGSQSSVTETALVAPQSNLPAQDQINAFAAAAAATPSDPVTASANALPDLATINAPIPQLLAERAVLPEPAIAAGNPEVALLETSVDPIDNPAGEQTTYIAVSGNDFVPLPIRRPGERAGDIRATGLPAANQSPRAVETPRVENSIEIASLELPSTRRGGRIASAFAPAVAPGKAARPSVADAGKGQLSTRTTAPKLTEDIISRWALDNKREVGGPNPATRNRRFVAIQLNNQPREVYAVGFVRNGEDLQHNKFTGQAVNFMEVARFGPSS